MSNNFFENVKKWTVDDYNTPGIKAEVILDMLVSEFVEDLIRYHYKSKLGKDVEVTLLAKEYPIRTSNANYLNAKVDYLVCINKEELLLVELKTTKDSYSNPQRGNMENAVNCGVTDLIKFYFDICNLKNGNTLDCKKYKFSRKKFNENLSKTGLNEESVFNVSKSDYLYILLYEDSRILDKSLILTDYCGNEEFKNSLVGKERQELWDNISEILSECADS